MIPMPFESLPVEAQKGNSEDLPEYTSKMRKEVRNMVRNLEVQEFNRQSLRGGWPFPLITKPRGFFKQLASLFKGQGFK